MFGWFPYKTENWNSSVSAKVKKFLKIKKIKENEKQMIKSN